MECCQLAPFITHICEEPVILRSGGGRSKEVANLRVKFERSDLRRNATVAMRTFFQDEGDLEYQSEGLEKIAEKGKEAMKSNLGQVVLDAFPRVDAFVDLVDNFVKVR